jgi:hypothetical protein
MTPLAITDDDIDQHPARQAHRSERERQNGLGSGAGGAVPGAELAARSPGGGAGVAVPGGGAPRPPPRRGAGGDRGVPAHGHPGRDHREHRPPPDPAVPGLLHHRPVAGAERLHPDLRWAAAAWGAAPATSSAAAGCSAPASCSSPSPRCSAAWPPPRAGCWPPAPSRGYVGRTDRAMRFTRRPGGGAGREVVGPVARLAATHCLPRTVHRRCGRRCVLAC